MTLCNDMFLILCNIHVFVQSTTSTEEETTASDQDRSKETTASDQDRSTKTTARDQDTSAGRSRFQVRVLSIIPFGYVYFS